MTAQNPRNPRLLQHPTLAPPVRGRHGEGLYRKGRARSPSGPLLQAHSGQFRLIPAKKDSRENRLKYGAVSVGEPPRSQGQFQGQGTFDRRTGELNGSLFGSALFTLRLTDYGQRSILINALPKEDWWTPPQVALVEDRSRIWQLQRFQPSDALLFPGENGGMMRRKSSNEETPSNAQLMSGGWEHEHCELCWQKILEHGGVEGAGYTDRRNRLCGLCYEKFIVPRLSKD